MTKLFFTVLMLFTVNALAYEFNEDSFDLLQKALAKSEKPEKAECSLPEDFGLIINNPSEYHNRAFVCTDAIKTHKNFPPACKGVEGTEYFEEVREMNAKEKKYLGQMILIYAVETRTLTVQDSSPEAVIITNVLCVNDKEEESSEQVIATVKKVNGKHEMTIRKFGF